MGRRSTKTTKTGKFMNPTDQYRKQQRRKELKKNKKQRAVVREAVLRTRDVGGMLDEIEEIEKQQLTSLAGQPQHNEKGLEEKKAKLHASVHSVVAYYATEDPKKADEIRIMIMESEKRRREMGAVYSSYRAARSECSIDEIPLPADGVLPADIPMPSEPKEILSADHAPPGPPPGPPPPDLPEYTVVQAQKKVVSFAPQENDSDTEDTQPIQPPSNIALVPPPPPVLMGIPPPPLAPPPLMPPTRPHIQSGAILSGNPMRRESEDQAPATIISAQPQLRNMTAEVTKFMPTSLKVRRAHPKPVKVKPSVPAPQPVMSQARPAPTQGDAYDTFMKEMQGLL